MPSLMNNSPLNVLPKTAEVLHDFSDGCIAMWEFKRMRFQCCPATFIKWNVIVNISGSAFEEVVLNVRTCKLPFTTAKCASARRVIIAASIFNQFMNHVHNVRSNILVKRDDPRLIGVMAHIPYWIILTVWNTITAILTVFPHLCQQRDNIPMNFPRHCSRVVGSIFGTLNQGAG